MNDSQAVKPAHDGALHCLKRLSRNIEGILATNEIPDFLPAQADALDALIGKFTTVYERTVIPLRIRRNQLLPIHKLPDEILTRILWYWYNERMLTPFNHCASRRPMGRQLLVSWVCRKWRSLLLSNATFWTYIDNVEPKHFIWESLKRSKNASLHINCEGSYTNGHLFLSDLLKLASHRIETLEIVDVKSDQLIMAVGKLERGTPRLRHLRINLGYCVETLFRNIEIQTRQGAAIDLGPFITRLYGSLPWTAFDETLTPTIRDLRIQQVVSIQSTPLFLQRTPQNFTLNLQSCSAMKTLDLNWNSRAEFNPYVTLTHASVDKLHTLILHGIYDLALLDRIQLPNLKRLVCTLKPTLLAHYELVSKHIDFSRIINLEIGNSGYYGQSFVQISGSSGETDPKAHCCNLSCPWYSSLSWANSTNAELQFCFGAQEEGYGSSNVDVFNSLLIKNIVAQIKVLDSVTVRNFRVRRNFGSLDDFFAPFAQRYCRSLVIQDASHGHFFEKLHDNNICIGLEQVAFSLEPRAKKNNYVGKAVLKFANARRKGNHPIKRIHVRGCSSFSEEIVAGLERIGVELLENVAPRFTDSAQNDASTNKGPLCPCPCFLCLQSPHNPLT